MKICIIGGMNVFFISRIDSLLDEDNSICGFSTFKPSKSGMGRAHEKTEIMHCLISHAKNNKMYKFP